MTNACAAGNFSIARAVDELEKGNADVMIAAGVDAMSWVAFTGFSSLRAMSPDICRPFDKNRKGLILGEGAGVLILEKLEHLLKKKSLVSLIIKINNRNIKRNPSMDSLFFFLSDVVINLKWSHL